MCGFKRKQVPRYDIPLRCISLVSRGVGDTDFLCSYPLQLGKGSEDIWFYACMPTYTISSFIEIHWWDILGSGKNHTLLKTRSFMDIYWKVMKISWDPEKNHRFWKSRSASRRPSWIFPQFRNNVQPSHISNTISSFMEIHWSASRRQSWIFSQFPNDVQ